MRLVLRHGGTATVDADSLTLLVQTGRHRVSGTLDDEVALGHALQQLRQWLPHYREEAVPDMVRRLLEAFAAAHIAIETVTEPPRPAADAG